MNTGLLKLIEIGGEALAKVSACSNLHLLSANEPIVKQLELLLKRKNGFYAFESALHIFPLEATQTEMGLKEWNKEDLWIADYQGMANEAVFFAEDIFGGQFCIKHDGIYTFDPEVAEFEYFAENLEQWAEKLLYDYDFITGYPLARKWQEKYGALKSKKRLVPKIPFVMQGDFSIENLLEIDSVKGMKWRADLAIQICNLADGDSVELKVIE